jgi:acyl carrier protein
MLPDYMIPAAFVTLAALPLTPNGKLDRKALPQPGAREETANSVPPGTAAELALAKLWCEVLGLKSVGIHDNFFDLGGHSLMATQLIARLERDHDLELSLRDIFDSPTIAAMCKWFADEGVPQIAEMPGSYRVESRA